MNLLNRIQIFLTVGIIILTLLNFFMFFIKNDASCDYLWAFNWCNRGILALTIIKFIIEFKNKLKKE